MRAEFVMSVRRLEIGMERLREKAMARLGPADKRATEINRLQAELDNKAALIVTLRTQAEWHKTVARKIVKLLLYIFARTRRRQKPAVVAPPLFKFEQGPQWEFKKQPMQSGYASAAAPIAGQNAAGPSRSCRRAYVCGQSAAVQNDLAVAAPTVPAKMQPAQNGLATIRDAVSAQRATAAKRPRGHRGGYRGGQSQTPPRDLKQSLRERRRISAPRFIR